MSAMDHYTLIQKLILYLPPLLFAITMHETAHGWIANLLGDPTAKMLGRLSINPIKHIDPIGTVIVPTALYFLGGFVFGWAKPVPITWQNLKKPRRDTLLVAAAGPTANFLMAIIWAAIARIALELDSTAIIYMGLFGIKINLVLCILNLIPIPPLDGSRVISSLLPPRIAYKYNRIEPYGFFILLALLATGVLSYVIWPATTTLTVLIANLFGLQAM